ncbi:hypothetical protein ACVFYP_22150 [Roseomonas sp. F4]
MIFRLPHNPLCFEIPDEWWDSAAMNEFASPRTAYLPKPDEHRRTTTFLPLSTIRPPIRGLGAPLDFRGLDRARFVDVLKGFATNTPLPPIEVLAIPEGCGGNSGAAWTVYNGYHRFYASCAAGFTEIPAIEVAQF